MLHQLQLRARLVVNGHEHGQEVVHELQPLPEDPRILRMEVQALRDQQTIEELRIENRKLRNQLRPWWAKLLRLQRWSR
jgi:FtsZ-binding cell division protein ZapB